MAKEPQLGQDTLIYAVLRRPTEERSFRVPIQGCYEG